MHGMDVPRAIAPESSAISVMVRSSMSGSPRIAVSAAPEMYAALNPRRSASFADGHQPGVAPVAVPLALLGVAPAAVQLEREVADAQRRFRRHELRLRCLARGLVPAPLQRASVIGERPCGGQGALHLRELHLALLEFRERPPELLPSGDVQQRLLERCLAYTERLGGDAQPSVVEDGLGDVEALSGLAQHGILRELGVLEQYLSRGAAPHSQGLEAVAEGHALDLFGEEGGDALGSAGEDEVHLGLAGIGRVGLLSAEGIASLSRQRAALDASRVGPCLWFREGEARELLPGDQSGEKALLLRRRPEALHSPGDGAVDAGCERGRSAGLRDVLGARERNRIGKHPAAALLREGRRGEALRSELLQALAGKLALSVDARCARRDLPRAERSEVLQQAAVRLEAQGHEEFLLLREMAHAGTK